MPHIGGPVDNDDSSTILSCSFPGATPYEGLAFDVYLYDIGNEKEYLVTDHYSLNLNGHSDTNGYIYFTSERNGNVDLFRTNFTIQDIINNNNNNNQFIQLTNSTATPFGSLNDRIAVDSQSKNVIFSSTRLPSNLSHISWSAIYQSIASASDSYSFESNVERITPTIIANSDLNQPDFSPVWSPNGEFIASTTKSGINGYGNIVLITTTAAATQDNNENTNKKNKKDSKNRKNSKSKSTSSKSNRRLLATNAGWPTFSADNKTLYFHRYNLTTSMWSIWSIDYSEENSEAVQVSPVSNDLNVLTPSASLLNNKLDFITVGVRSNSDNIRKIGLLNIKTSKISYLKNINSNVMYYNPHLSPDGNYIFYHRCRGLDIKNTITPNVKRWDIPNTLLKQLGIGDVAYIQTSGDFPVLSRILDDGSDNDSDGGAPMIAVNPSISDTVNQRGIDVMYVNGTNRHRVYDVSGSFYNSWSPDNSKLYSCNGFGFEDEDNNVGIIEVDLNSDDSNDNDNGNNNNYSYKIISQNNTHNNAFLSFNYNDTNGNTFVFRSSRDVENDTPEHYNLYISKFDSTNGGISIKDLKQITNGSWIDTHPNWSPNGEWIAFASNRPNTLGNASDFGIYMIRPNGTDLKYLIDTQSPQDVPFAKQSVHPWFSPNSKYFVFTSSHSGESVEEIGMPFVFAPQSDLVCICKIVCAINRKKFYFDVYF